MNLKKLFFSITTSLLFSNSINSQSIQHNDFLNYELDLNNFGTLKNNNNTSNLYSFYTLNKDPKEKQSKAYLKFYDENLIETNKIGFELNPKTNIFLEITDNNQNVVVSFLNPEIPETEHKIYSSTGELLNSIKVKTSNFNFAVKYEFYYAGNKAIKDIDAVFPIKENGFLITETAKKKRLGYNIHYLNNNNTLEWVYESPAEHNNRKAVTPLCADNETIVLLEKEWGSNLDRQPTFKVIFLDTKTGKELFSTSHDYETTPNFYTRATITQNKEIVLFGETYPLNNNYPDNDYNTGYYIEKYSREGKLLSKNNISFTENAFKESLGIDINAKQKEFGTIYFNDMIEKEGKIYTIGQLAKREVQGGTFGKVLLSSMGGAIGGAVNNWAWQSKYILNEMVALEFDTNCKLTNTFKFNKTPTLTGLNSLVVRPYFNFIEMDNYNRLDYIGNTSTEDKFNGFYFSDKSFKDNTQNIEIKKVTFENNKLAANDFLKFETNTNESRFKVLSRNSNSVYVLKLNYTDGSLKIDVIK